MLESERGFKTRGKLAEILLLAYTHYRTFLMITDSIFSEWDQGYCNPATGEFRDSAATGFVLAWDLGTDTEYPALNCFSTFSPAQQRETAARALAGETLVE